MVAPELVPQPRLRGLLDACQRNCVADCCGIDAYDFSPLYVAAYLSAFTGVVSDDDIRTIEEQLDALASEAAQLGPDKDGHVCSICGMNQYFTRDLLNEVIVRVKHAVRLAPRVIEAVRQIEEESGHQRFATV